MPTPALTTSDQLAPSEVVLLLANTFVDKGSLLTGTVRHLRSEAKVNSKALGTTLLRTAILANVAAGAVTLEERETKKLFGLMKGHTTMATRTGAAVTWPAGSLEAAVGAALAGAGGTLAMMPLIVHLMEADSAHPLAYVVALATRGLVSRGLVTMREAKTLKVFTVTEASVTAAANALADGESGDPIRRLLADYEAAHASTWTAMDRAIGGAVSSRTLRDKNLDND